MGKYESVDELLNLLRSFGMAANDVLVVEAPGDNLESGGTDFAGLQAAFLKIVCANGTLVVPTITPQEGNPKPAFDPILSPSEAGPFSEFFRQQPGVLRSHSPTHSVAAFGAAATQIVSGHRAAGSRPTPWGDGPFGHGGPWDVLAEMDAWWIMVDAKWEDSPFVVYLKALYAESHSGLTKQPPFPEFQAAIIEQILAKEALLMQGSWEGHRVVVFRMRPALYEIQRVLNAEPELLAPSKEFRAWLECVDVLERNGYVQAGVSKVVITPEVPCTRWDGKQLIGVHRDLYARSLVLSDGQERLALVVCDLIGMSKMQVDRVRARIHAQNGLSAEKVMIVCTHSHSTPDTVGSGNGSPAYDDWLEETIADGVRQAAESLEPVRIGWGRTSIRGLAHSRRIKLKDGTVFTTRYGVPSTWRVDPNIIESQGEIDPDLTVVRIERLNQEVLGLVANFGCHPTVALMSAKLSGDFVGEAMHILEGSLGGGAVAFFANGSAADVDPTLEMPVWGPRNDANALRLGRILAAQILEQLERVTVADITKIQAAHEPIELPVREDWLQMLQLERERLSQEFATVSLDDPVLAQIVDGKAIHTEVHVLRLGDLCLLGLPGEVFTNTGLNLKARVPGRKVAVVEAANDFIGYILTPEGAAEGGYETGLHLFSRVSADAEERLLGVAESLIQRVFADSIQAEGKSRNQS